MASYGACRPTWGFHSRSMPRHAGIAPAFSFGRLHMRSGLRNNGLSTILQGKTPPETVVSSKVLFLLELLCVPMPCRIFRAQTIAQWGGCRPPHPPRDGVIKLMYCQGGGNACHGDSTVVRAPLNGPRVPSPSLTLYRRPRTARLPTDPTPALSRTRPTLTWRPMYRVPELSCRPCRPTTKTSLCHV